MTKATEAPKKITLTREEAEALKARIETGELTEKDRKIFLGLVVFNLWLQERLSRARLSIRRLRNLFGITTEKKTPKKKKAYW